MESGIDSDLLLVRFWIPNGDFLGTGTMIYPDTIAVVPTLQKPVYLLTGDGDVRKVSVDDQGYKIEESDAVPMLGSAITDASEKHIYQGDIVQLVGSPKLVEVVFVNAMFALLFQKEDKPFICPLLNFAGGPGIKIVGNICEDPEITTLFREEFHVV